MRDFLILAIIHHTFLMKSDYVRYQPINKTGNPSAAWFAGFFQHRNTR
jgi:hypothetical protein